ncbi:MAG: signal peptidase I [Ruminococcaceae bacterium]|nr:signal peptidase I [Oscillospiraceae bacterium]
MNNELEQQSAQKKKEETGGFLFDALEMFVWSLAILLLLFTFVLRLCRVEGASMENTLWDGENLLLYSFAYEPKQDDIVVFHLTGEEENLEKMLVKRVIATAGQTVEIDFKNNAIIVDGVPYDDEHAVLKNSSDVVIDRYLGNRPNWEYDAKTDSMTVTVPEGHLFVLGDNRNFSRDSRDSSIMFVDERCVLGKVILRVAPFTVFSGFFILNFN